MAKRSGPYYLGVGSISSPLCRAKLKEVKLTTYDDDDDNAADAGTDDQVDDQERHQNDSVESAANVSSRSFGGISKVIGPPPAFFVARLSGVMPRALHDMPDT